MLVLSRYRDEKIIVHTSDGPITVQIVAVDRGKVRVGIEAPKGCGIWREELLSRDDFGAAVKEGRP